MTRRTDKLHGRSLFELVDRQDPRFIEASMRYLNLSTDTVPPHFVQQWEFIQRKKHNRGAISKQLPYELVDQQLPSVSAVVAAAKQRKSTLRMSSSRVAVVSDTITEEELLFGRSDMSEDLKHNESLG